MAHTKIVTCCYCGTRAALVLNKERHELVCSSCGAPLHDLKMMRADAAKPKAAKHKPAKPHKSERDRGQPSDLAALYAATKGKKKSYKKKRKKGFAARFFDEAFDVIEDIFD
ncbi:MAG: hypothetical protein N4A61_11150 [Pelagimonas sp.]|jgi:transcription initiation factor TFIIIB Brf1 subunit/transcription initiation factor TFIIB|nr:hypothetical protein [Pelagimonas sp.]